MEEPDDGKTPAERRIVTTPADQLDISDILNMTWYQLHITIQQVDRYQCDISIQHQLDISMTVHKVDKYMGHISSIDHPALVVKRHLSSWRASICAADVWTSESLQVDQGSAQYTDAWRATSRELCRNDSHKQIKMLKKMLPAKRLYCKFKSAKTELLDLAVVIFQACTCSTHSLYCTFFLSVASWYFMILMQGHPASVAEEILGTPFSEAKMRRFYNLVHKITRYHKLTLWDIMRSRSRFDLTWCQVSVRHYSKMMAKWKTIFESQLQAFLRQIASLDIDKFCCWE